MSLGVRGIAEVVLWVRDMKSALGFYRDLFGLEVISPASLPNHFLRAASGQDGIPQMIVLVPHPDPSGRFPAEKRQRSLHHLALSVSPEGFDDLAQRCRAGGLEVRDGVHPVLGGVRTFYVDDPDGNEVEVIAPSP